MTSLAIHLFVASAAFSIAATAVINMRDARESEASLKRDLRQIRQIIDSHSADDAVRVIRELGLLDGDGKYSYPNAPDRRRGL